ISMKAHLLSSPIDESLPRPRVSPRIRHHYIEPQSLPYIKLPTQSLRQHFENEYSHHYKRIARAEYSRAYEFHFKESFYRRAEEQIEIYSDPQLYPEIAAGFERDAFDSYYQNARTESFNRDYPGLYQQVREKAYRSPDRNSPIYQDAYANGAYNAHSKIGNQEGFARNIRAFEEAEEARGFADRDRYYKSNAVFAGISFTLEDDNQDGVFAINEAFHLSVDFKNLGLKSQGSKQSYLRLFVLEGPAIETVMKFSLPPANPRAALSHRRSLSGLVNPDASIKQTIKIKAEFVDFGRVIHSQVFRIALDYPLDLSRLDHNPTLFSNQQNRTLARLSNPTGKTTPAQLELTLLDANGQSLARQTLPPLSQGGSRELDISYLISEEQEFREQALAIRITSQGVVQIQYDLPPSYASKRYAKESDILVFLPSLRNFDLLLLKDALAARGLGFDLFAIDQEDGEIDSLFRSYLNGYVVSDLGHNPDPLAARLLQRFYNDGGSLFVASPNISRSPAWVNFLPQFGLKLTEKTSTQTLKGQNHILGATFRNEFSTHSRLSFQVPQKNVISYPLIRSDKKRGFGFATFHASRSLHPINLNTFSLATFDLSELRPQELAFLVAELAQYDRPFDDLLNRLARPQTEKRLTLLSHQIGMRLTEAHSLGEKLKSKTHKATARETYNDLLEQYIDFAYSHSSDANLNPSLLGITNELARKRHASTQRSDLRALQKSLKAKQS
ncbi:MAG: hypothetical protein AAGB46_16380, partial [Verrucomicrobiota bacterium]